MSTKSANIPAVVISGTPEIWNLPCNLKLYLASRHDERYNYATFSTSEAIKNGFYLTGSVGSFKRRFVQGDTFMLWLDSRILTVAKINRATGDTLAFHCPPGIRLPKWLDNKSEVVELPVVVIGPACYRIIPKEHKIRPDEPPPLDAKLDTPAEKEEPAQTELPLNQVLEDGNNREETRLLVVGPAPIRVYKLGKNVKTPKG